MRMRRVDGEKFQNRALKPTDQSFTVATKGVFSSPPQKKTYTHALNLKQETSNETREPFYFAHYSIGLNVSR